MTIDCRLKFNTHISNICKKASKQLNVLKRIGKNLTKLGKLTIYFSFIMSNFNYCPVIWHFCGENNTRKMERIQERALRFIYDDYFSSYEQLLDKSSLPSLKLRRLRAMGIEVFKILNGKSPIYLQDLFVLKNSTYCFRRENTLNIPQVRTTTYGLHSFRYAGATIWNELPNEFRTASSLNQFKSLISNWNGDSCRCSSCRS